MGNGGSISVWRDRWLPIPNTFKVISSTPIFLVDLHVQNLIDVVNRLWNSNILALLLSHGDQLVIKSILLSLKFPADHLIWHYTAKGSFTVKSAYHVAYSSLQDHCLTASTYVGGSNSCSHLWSTLWRANVPNKFKICVWRATSNILANISNLVQRSVQIDQSCFLCNILLQKLLFKRCGIALF